MQVYWQKLLEALGCRNTVTDINARQPCPLHAHIDRTLELRRHPVTDSLQFICHAPECQFKGDAIALVSQARKLTVNQAIELFRPYHELNHTLAEYANIDEYVMANIEQAQVAGYLIDCQQAMVDDRGRYLQTLMADRQIVPYPAISAHGVCPDLGILKPGIAPHKLTELNDRRYARGYYALYPYTLDGVLTQVVIQDQSKAPYERKTIPITLDGGGIFIETNLKSDTQTVCIATDEQLACTLYWKASGVLNDMAIIGSQELRLPEICRDIRQIHIVAHTDNPLTLDQALKYLDDRSKYNLDKPVYVHEICGPVGQLDHTILQAITNDHTRLETWVLHTLQELTKGAPVEAVALMTNIHLTDRTRSQLLAYAKTKGMESQVIALLDSSGDSQRSYTLANGCKIRLTKTGLIGIRGNHPVQLSNIPFVVDQCVVQRDQHIAYQCRFMLSNDRHVRVIIDRDTALSIADITKTVQNAVVKHGYTDYVTFYLQPKLKWPDIFACMAADRPIVKEIEHLGVANDRSIHFPGFIIDTVNDQLLPQNAIYTIDNRIKTMYNLKTAECDDWEDEARQLLTTNNNVMAEGLICGFMHILGQQYLALAQQKAGVPHMPMHFFYVDEGGGSAWYEAFTQFSRLFSGYDKPPTISALDPANSILKLQPLGSLPAIISLPDMSGGKLNALIDTSPVSIISVINSRMAIEMAADPRVSFMVVPPTSNRSSYRMNSNNLVHAKTVLSRIMTHLLSSPVSYCDEDELRLGRIVSMAAYQIVCKRLQMNPDVSLLNRLNWYYSDIKTDIQTFINTAYKLVYQSKDARKFGIMHTDSIPTASWVKKHGTHVPHIIKLDDCVMVNVSIVALCNNYAHIFAFRSDVITAELVKNNYLADPPRSATVKLGNYWCIRRDVWDAHIKQIPIDIQPIIDENGSIPLRLVSSGE